MIASAVVARAPAGTVHNNWASSLFFQGRPLEAEPLYRRAFDILTNVEADGRDFMSGWQFNYYARTLAELHRLPEAARYAEQAIVRSKGTTNRWMAKAAPAGLTRAGIHREMGEARRAEQLLAQVEPTIEGSPTESAYMALALSERGLLAQARGDLPAALSLMTRALTTVEANPHSSSAPRYLGAAIRSLPRHGSLRTGEPMPSARWRSKSRRAALPARALPVSAAPTSRSAVRSMATLLLDDTLARRRLPFTAAVEHLGVDALARRRSSGDPSRETDDQPAAPESVGREAQ